MYTIENIIDDAISALKGHVFKNEDDFKNAFANAVKELNCCRNVFTEYPAVVYLNSRPSDKPNAISTDIMVEYDGELFPVELKYKKAEFSGKDITGKQVVLKSDYALDINRYQVWEDVEKIEALKKNNKCSKGFVIFLTNEPNYWAVPNNPTIDQKFKFFDKKNQDIFWTKKPGTKVTDEGYMDYRNFKLNKKYIGISWTDYFHLPPSNGEFKYIIITI